jgi:hypothetical protein
MKYTEARAVEMRKQLKKDRKAMGISNKLAYAQ